MNGPDDLAAWARGVGATLLATIALFISVATAAEVRLDDSGVRVMTQATAPGATRWPDPTAPLGLAVSVLDEAHGHPLELPEAQLRLATGAFRASTAAVPTLGNHAPPRWLHLDIRNDAGGPRHYRVYVAEGWADRVDAWLLDADGRMQYWRGGDARSPGRYLRPGLGFAFDARLPRGRSELFVRADSIDAVALALRLVPLRDSGRLESEAQHWQGVVHGFLLALVAIFGLLWLALREASLLRYVAYVGSYLYMHLAYSGVAAQMLWPESPQIARFAILVGMVLFASAGLWFAREFLALRHWAPRTDRAVAWLVRGALAVMLAFVVAGTAAPAVTLAFGYMMLFTVAMVVLGVMGVRRARMQAWPFLVASIASMAGAFVTTLAVMGRLPFNAITFRAVEIGVMCEAAIWALTLGLRLRRDREDRVRALALAQHDPLTGLCNRRGFLERGLPLHEASCADASPLSLLLVDIDHFKSFNDRHGHETGDRVLVAVADRLRAVSRLDDVIARWGGEEFVLLLPACGCEQALEAAERVRTAVAGLAVELPDGDRLCMTVSVGIACDAPSPGLETLIRQADTALYAAKEAGRNRVESAVATPPRAAAGPVAEKA